MTAPFEAFFLPVDGDTANQRFCLFHPAQGPSLRGAIVYIHPFAEEMNKSRRMAAMQSRALAQAGYAVLQMDLLGCGDSSRDFGDASWQAWIDDVVRGCHWLSERVQAPLWLWGLRVGCLLTMAAASRFAGHVNHLLWAPVTSGKQALQQFLRLKLASDLTSGSAGSAVGAIASLRQDLAQGRSIEIAGYRISGSLANGLEAAQLTLPANQLGSGRIEWFELSTREPATLSPAGTKTTEAWRIAGHANIRAHVINGPSFWQTLEIEDASTLLSATVAALSEGAASMSYHEEAMVFGCHDEQLIGIASEPTSPRTILGSRSDIGVIIIVGGPQYRVGSHRQFLLLARSLAEAGITTLRFDVRGMGDSTGQLHAFESISSDIATAIDALLRQAPHVGKVVLWGLCDGASAALMYYDATQDPRVRGLCLLNPWVRSETSLARAHVKHYYVDRLRQKEFWLKLLSGRVAASALTGLWRSMRLARKRPGAHAQDVPFQERMAQGWRGFEGSILLILSGDDYTAKEFIEYTQLDKIWEGLLAQKNVVRHDMPEADHTCSAESARAAVEALTLSWIVRDVT